MIRVFHLLLGVALAAWLGVGAARADALIQFPNVSAQADPPHLFGYLGRPDGAGPFPAVVVLHGCTGFLSRYAEIAERLKWSGYVALAIDSLGPRGLGSACDRLFIEQATDAYAALEYLSQQAFVDPRRVAVLGYSMGGFSALLAVQRGAVEQLFERKFRGAIAYYPWCRDPASIMGAPAMILVGGADDWTPPEACREMAAQPREGSAPVDLTVYPDAYHGFDNPSLKPGIRVLNHWLEYNEAAATNAWGKVGAFLTVNLAPATADKPKSD